MTSVVRLLYIKEEEEEEDEEGCRTTVFFSLSLSSILDRHPSMT
jgi:hypothetical protein